MKRSEMTNTLRRLVRHPNAERAAETTNHLAEDMFDLVTRQRAIEAAAFWRDEAERIRQRLNAVRSVAVLKATELVHDVCKESVPNAGALASERSGDSQQRIVGNSGGGQCGTI